MANILRNPLLILSLLACVIGVVTGVGAAIFRMLVSIVHNLAFYGEFSIYYDANLFGPPSSWGPLIILAPVIGGLIVVWMVENYAPEARGHGVPEVMYAIFYREGIIRPVVAAVKILASALSIGSGASVGREGPIIQIGSAFGSTLGQWVRVEPWQRITMVASGAAAGIAATFNTPLGGVLFAIELLMPEVSTRTFLPVVISAGIATFIGRLFFGAQPAFLLNRVGLTPMEDLSLETLALIAVLGILAGIGAWLFIRLLTRAEFFFEGLKTNPYVKNILGMLLIGGIMYGLFLYSGQYHTAGVGYATIQAILDHKIVGFGFLLTLFLLKLVATSVSLASGASGGVFAPSLFMGATLGGAFGAFVIPYFGVSDFTLSEFGIVAMASMVGAGTGAAMTAIIMIFEMTRDFHVLFPAIFAVALAIGVRRLLSDENIYTIKLAWRGIHIPKDRHTNMFLVRHAKEVLSRDFFVMEADLPVQEGLKKLPESPDSEYIVVARDNHITGVILIPPSLHALEQVGGHVTLGQIADRKWIIALPEQSMFEIFPRLARRHARYVIVVDGGGIPHADQIQGIIARAQITDAVIENFGKG